MTRVALNGLDTWVHLPRRRGKTVVLLHGGLSSSTSLLRVLAPRLKSRFAIAAFDRRGHGRTADTNEDFSYDAMADETIAFLEFLNRRVYLVGHSDGGNVALLVALRRPDLVRRVVAIGANYHHDGLMPMEEFTPESPGFAEFAEGFGERSPDGSAHAAEILRKNAKMLREQPTLTTDDLRSIFVPTLVLCGDDDVATLSHTASLYEALPEAQLAIVPGTSHALLKERPKESSRIIKRFLLRSLPPATRYPLRRRSASGE